MNKIKIAVGISALLVSLNAAAVPTTAGNTDLAISGDLYTFTFDLVSADINGSDGLFFSNADISWSLYAEATNAGGSTTLRQDFPGDGGLGVPGGTFDDNWEAGESLNFSISDGTLFDLVGFTVNGGNGGDHGNCVPSNSWYRIDSSKGGEIGSTFMSRDGCPVDMTGDISFDPGFQDIASFEIADSGRKTDPFDPDTLLTPWTGYLESLTIRVDSVAVPVPSAFALFTLGLVGLGVTRRRRI